MITQRLKIDGANIVKQDGSLFPAWGHNYDNLNILDIGAYGEIIENVWNDNLYAKGGVFTVNKIAWSYVSGNGPTFTYNVTLTLNEPLTSDTFTVGTDKVTIAGSPSLTSTSPINGASIIFSIEGAATDAANNRQAISNINTVNNTITFQQQFSNFVNNNTSGISITNICLVGLGSIELDLAIMKNIAKSRIIRICLQMDQFMLDDQGYQSAIDASNGGQIDPTDTEDVAVTGTGTDIVSTTVNTNPFAVDQGQLDALYAFCDLAAKYDLYVIINGVNSWIAGNQPDWLSWANDADRWTAQASFWASVANAVKTHPAVAWYSLINEPVEQFDDAVITYYVQNDDGTYNAYGTNQSGTGFPSDKLNGAGFALLTDTTGNKVELLYYQSLTFSGNTININGFERLAYGSYPQLSEEEIVGSYVSLIYKEKDIDDLKLVQTTEGSTTAIIDLLSNATAFKPQSSSDIDTFGFVGDSVIVGTGLTTPISQRYSSQLASSLSPLLTEQNFGASNAILSSNNHSSGVPTGYGQVLKNYPNGNDFKFNSINFGKEDFKLYGISQGYNDGFFTQSLKVILSRLSTKFGYVTEFSNLSGFTTVDSTVNTAAYSASGGSYQRYQPVGGSGSTTVTITTPLNFIAGETLAIGFMVEYGSTASATISVNGNTYTQGLTSGTDVYKPSTNDSNYFALPVVKRLNALPAGENTITITLNVTNGTACLDYWQIESSDPRPIFLNSIDNNIPTSIVPLAQDGLKPMIKWNQKITKLIQAEFFDRNIYFIDVNSSKETNLILASDYDSNNNLNASGHTKILNTYKKIIKNDALLPDYGVTVSSSGSIYTYTYTTGSPHYLKIGDKVTISGATPSNVNGSYTVKTVLSPNIFTVIGPVPSSTPSIENATYSRQQLKPNTTYRIYGETIPKDGRISFTTGDTIVDSNGLYTVTLSNSNGVVSSSLPESCTITNDTQWVGQSFFNSDRHYIPYLSLMPRGVNSKTVVRNWIIKMKDAIRNTGGDQYTPITIPSTSFYGKSSEFTNGFGPANINDLVNIFSPHQYPISYKAPTDLAVNLSIFKDYNKPTILEEGAFPLNTTVRQTTNYILNSKRYLAGGLNSYQGYYKFTYLGSSRWYPWTSDIYKSQYIYDSLNPFINDAPIDNPESSTIHSAYDGPSNFSDQNVNKPEIIGNRYMIPEGDIEGSSGFSFLKSDSLSPTNEPTITIDGSYTAQTQLTKSGSALPQNSTIYLNSIDSDGALAMYFNSFYKSSNQDILYIKPVANFNHNTNAMVFRNQRPSVATQSGTRWSIYPSGSDFVAAVNGTGTTTLSTAITSTAGSISFTVASASAFAASGVVLIDEEYIKYTKSGNVLTVPSTGRGYSNTIPTTHNAGATVRGITPLATTIVRNSVSNSSTEFMDWTLSTPSSLPSGKSVYQIDVWVCLFTGYSDKATRQQTSAATLTTSGVLTFANSSTIANFGVGAFLADDSGVIDRGVYVLSKSNNTLTMTKDGTTVWKPASNIHTGAYINATNAPLTATIKLYDSTRSSNYKTINYKGNWFNPDILGTDSAGRQGLKTGATNPPGPDYPRITYSLGDLISYKQDDGIYRVYRSLQNNNYYSINTTYPYDTNSYWQLIGTCDTNPTDFVWIKISLYKDSATGIWKDVNTGEQISNNSYFDPSNLRVSAINTTPSTYTRPSTKYISIAAVYADQFTDGNIDAVDATLGTMNLYTDIFATAEPNAKISFKNNTNGWVQADNGLGQQNTGQFYQDTLDSMFIIINKPINSSSQTTHTKSYTTFNVSNFNINTVYLEVKMKETLARKGNPIVSMG